MVTAIKAKLSGRFGSHRHEWVTIDITNQIIALIKLYIWLFLQNIPKRSSPKTLNK